MADKLVSNESFFARGEPGWHKKGTVVPRDGHYTVKKAVKIAHADFPVIKVPVPPMMAFGQQVKLEDEYYLFCQPIPGSSEVKKIGSCKDKYEIVQNIELAEVLHNLGEVWPVETVGVLSDGAEIFITLDMGLDYVAGDEVRKYCLIYNTHDGKGALQIMFVTVRVVCWNTLQTGLATATHKVMLRHYKGVLGDLEWTAETMQKLYKAEQVVLSRLERLAQFKLAAGEEQKVWETAYPLKQSTKGKLVTDVGEVQGVIGHVDTSRFQYAVENDNYLNSLQFEHRRNCDDLYEKFNDEFPHLAQTYLAGFNVVCEMESWRPGGNKEINSLLPKGERTQNMARTFKYLDKRAAELVG